MQRRRERSRPTTAGRASEEDDLNQVCIIGRLGGDPETADLSGVDVLADAFRVMQQQGEDDVILLGDLNADEHHLRGLGQLQGIKYAIAGVTTNTRAARPNRLSNAHAAMACIILPRPISSARMPPKPFARRNASTSSIGW